MKELLQKISIITFMLYYIVIASGVDIKLHYCEGELSDFAINSNNTFCEIHQEDSCEGGSCDSHIDDQYMHCELDLPAHHCCSNQEVYIALNSLITFSSKNFKIQNSEIELVNNTQIEKVFNDDITEIIINHNTIDYNYPPPYLEFQQLLIYS